MAAGYFIREISDRDRVDTPVPYGLRGAAQPEYTDDSVTNSPIPYEYNASIKIPDPIPIRKQDRKNLAMAITKIPQSPYKSAVHSMSGTDGGYREKTLVHRKRGTEHS